MLLCYYSIPGLFAHSAVVWAAAGDICPTALPSRSAGKNETENYVNLYRVQHTQEEKKSQGKTQVHNTYEDNHLNQKLTSLAMHCSHVVTVVSRVSAHRHLKLTRDFGPHGCLPRI